MTATYWTPPTVSVPLLPAVKVAAVASGQFANVTFHGRSVIGVLRWMAAKSSVARHCASAGAEMTSARRTMIDLRIGPRLLRMRQRHDPADEVGQRDHGPGRAELLETGRKRRAEIAFPVQTEFDRVRERDAEIVRIDRAEIDRRIRRWRDSDGLQTSHRASLAIVALLRVVAHEFPPSDCGEYQPRRFPTRLHVYEDFR